VACFNISIPIKKIFTKLFGVTQQEDESTHIYLKRFNVEELFELVVLKALIKGGKGACPSAKTLYLIIQKFAQGETSHRKSCTGERG
jgi:hypothetical protein